MVRPTPTSSSTTTIGHVTVGPVQLSPVSLILALAREIGVRETIDMQVRRLVSLCLGILQQILSIFTAHNTDEANLQFHNVKTGLLQRCTGWSAALRP